MLKFNTPKESRKKLKNSEIINDKISEFVKFLFQKQIVLFEENTL